MLLFIGFHAESRAYLRKQEWAVDHYDEVKAQMENYLEAGKYYEFYAYCDSYHLTGWTAGPFLEYYPVMEGAQIYYFLNSHINQYLAADNVYDRNEQLEDICGLLQSSMMCIPCTIRRGMWSVRKRQHADYSPFMMP